MPALNTDLLKKLSRRWVGQIGAGGVADASVATIPLSSTTNLATDTAVVATIDRVDANGTATPSLEETIIGVVSGSNLVTSTRGVEGTAQAHSAGAVVEILVTAKGWNDLVDMLLVGHTQLGAHAANVIGASNIVASAVTSGKIAASGVVAGNLAASSILAGNHAASSVLAGNMAASSVVLGNLAASSVSSGNLNFLVGGLSSKTISSTRDMTAASGNVAYTGAGFVPTAIFVFYSISSTFTFGMGSADSALAGNTVGNDASGNMRPNAGYLITAYTSPTTNQLATVASFDADGFTLTWTKTSTPTGTLSLFFTCFR